jgi:hypothetical protein
MAHDLPMFEFTMDGVHLMLYSIMGILHKWGAISKMSGPNSASLHLALIFEIVPNLYSFTLHKIAS